MNACPFAKRIAFLLLCLCSAAVVLVPAQTVTRDTLKRSLAEKAGFEDQDFANLEKGGTVIKNLNSAEKREIAVVGVVKIIAPNEVVLGAFRRTIGRQDRKTSKQSGAFSSTPVLDDLDNLTIEDSEIEDLKTCRVNRCKWNLPEDVIKRIASEIDWSAEGHRSLADELIRKIIVEYVTEYSRTGDSALYHYNDKPGGLSLRDEYVSLQQNMFWAKDYSPRLFSFLEKFPNGPPDGVRTNLNWSKIKIGLKPVIIITQNITYQQDVDGTPMSFVVSKQIYANHYFDSTLSETAAFSFERGDGVEETYLMFLNRSRAAAFTTTLGRLARRIVENQAESKLDAVLKDTRKYSSLALANREADLAVEEPGLSLTGIFTSAPFILGFIVVAIGLTAYLFVTMVRRQR